MVIATLLDFDGVLVDSEPIHLAAFNDVFAEQGLSIGEKEYLERYLSLDDAGVFRAVLSRDGRTVREEAVRAAVAAKAPAFMKRFATTFRTFPGAALLVERRAARGPVGIVSGALLSEIEFALDKMGVRSSVSFIVSAESAPVSKPDPTPFLVAIERLRQNAYVGKAVVVEDSIGGVIAAKGAALRCVAVAHSHPQSDLLRAGADAVVANLAELGDDILEAGL